MQVKKLGTAAVAGCLSFLVALGLTGCFVTAFDLNVPDPKLILYFCIGAAFLCALFGSFSKGGIAIALLWVGFLLWLWKQGDFYQQFWQMIYRISYLYNRGYRWGVFKLVETPWNAGTAELPMILLVVGTAATTAWTLIRNKSGLLPMALTVLIFSSTVVLTDTVPEEAYLYCYLLGLTLVIFTGHSRRERGGQSAYLACLLAVPTALALAGLFWALPQDTYVSHEEKVQQQVISLFEKLPKRIEPDSDIRAPLTPMGEPEQVDLSALGPRQESPIPVMHAETETGGTLYLRGQDYDIYDGRHWQAEEHRVEEFTGIEGTNLGYVVVKTKDVLKQQYLPYYPRGGLSLIGGQLENFRITENYAYVRMGLPDNWKELAALEEEKAAALPFAPAQPGGGQRYLALPEETRLRAILLLTPLLEGVSTTTEKAEAIASYVRQAAFYSKEAQRMPEGEQDFALWFLEKAEQGYCVHFATAAAVLLRAADIEARYVSGYLADTQPGKETVLTGKHAHAWTEYYDPGLKAWLVLDATPGTDALPPEMLTETEAPLPSTPAEPTQSEVPETTVPEETALMPPETTELPVIPESMPENPEEPERTWLPILLGMAAVLLAELQRRLRIFLRKFTQSRGSENQRALKLWRETERLAKRQKTEPPELLRQLALKAKFSQHTLTEEELTQFTAYRQTSQERLRQKPWYRRLIDRYLLALY